ncbi:MAG: serine/threonine-protein kinase [Betaproteobacteria bacterium]
MPTVLLVDPSASRSGFVVRALSAFGHEAQAFSDVASATESLYERQRDVVVLVDVPPRLDALDFVQALRMRGVVFASSLIVLATDSRRREVGSLADLVLPLSATESLLANAISLVLKGERRRSDLAAVPRSEGALRPRGPETAPGAVAAEPAAAQAMVNGYRVIRPLGRGGMAMVYLALHEETGQERVLKLLPISDHDGGDLVQRLINEAALLSQIRHPGIARIYDQGFTQWHAYIGMEHLQGGELRAAMGRPMAPAVALDIVLQIAGALGAVHEAGIVHRDLKPENVMRRHDGSHVLVDFGIARQEGVQLSYLGTGQVMGTAGYLAPEYLKHGVGDHRADIYSLGIILHEMLTGRKPYENADTSRLLEMHLNAPLPELPPRVASCQEVLDRMMAKDPGRRFQNTGYLIDAVTSVIANILAGEAAPRLGFVANAAGA